jgi:hypothetical protein
MAMNVISRRAEAAIIAANGQFHKMNIMWPVLLIAGDPLP